MPAIPINIDDLVNARTVETARLEFKNGINEEQTQRQIIATISAFANDFHNLNGGYVLLGIEEHNGVATLPPVGIPEDNIDEIQKKIRGQLNRIQPEYYPIIEPIEFQDKKIIAIWCPPGEARPYLAPPVRMGEKEFAYHIRQGSETVEARGEIKEELLRLTAKIPFDDRAAFHLEHEVLEQTIVKRFLIDSSSKLAESGQSFLDTLLDLRVVRKMNGHYAPLHVGLLFFTSRPDTWLQGAKSEIVQFGDEAGGEIVETPFSGPIQEQIRNILRFLESVISQVVQKIPNQAEALRFVAFPYGAMEEAIVNAFYHRGYDNSAEPVKIYLYPDRMEIISYPGPVPGIKPEHFFEGNRVPPVANRNRRIGDFLKQIRLAEMRNTGIPAIIKDMKRNGSPAPKFDFDEERTYFRVTLSAHPRYTILHAIREAAYLWATGQKNSALVRLAEVKELPESGRVWAQIIDYKASSGDINGAEAEWNELVIKTDILDKSAAARAIASALSLVGERQKALKILRGIQPSTLDVQEIIDSAILYKNLGDLEEAHRIFQNSLTTILQDSRALNEFGDIKLKLAKNIYRSRSSEKLNAYRRLLNESAEMYRRVIQLTDDDVRRGWCWFRLAEVFDRLKLPKTEVEQAYQMAISFLPSIPVVKEQYQFWLDRISK